MANDLATKKLNLAAGIVNDAGCDDSALVANNSNDNCVDTFVLHGYACVVHTDSSVCHRRKALKSSSNLVFLWGHTGLSIMYRQLFRL